MDNSQCTGPFRTAAPLILASSSPRRKRLLAGVGLSFVVKPAGVKEPCPLPRQSPSVYAEENAFLKAADVAPKAGDGLVLGADTIVVVDEVILGKPKDDKEALKMLVSLAGRWHRVITGCAIIWPRKKMEKRFSVASRVFIADLGQKVIESYIKTGEGRDKAGSYGVQGIGSFLVKRINGSYTNVVGLPISETIKNLLEIGFLEVV